MSEIPMKRFAGAMMILIPVIFWIFMYLRYDCGGGSCSIKMNWLLVGFAAIIFGLILVLTVSDSNATKKSKL
jgi:hypothetical protein